MIPSACDVRGTGRAIRRAPFFAVVLTLLLAGLLSKPRPAHGQLADAVPTWWHEAAGLTPLLTAPPPENPATICLIDTGVTPTPDLDITARWAYDGGTLDDIRETQDSPGHGTLVAHFAAGAVNGWGGAGAFPHARISSVRVFPREGGASWQDYIRAITRCVKLDSATKVIVISIGGPTISPGESEELEHWIERARDRYGANVVVAAGNGGGAVDFPGRFAAAFTIAAADRAGELCAFSARGREIDLAAPGCSLGQGGTSETFWSYSGSSFAAPIVAGVLGALRTHVPEMTARDAESLLVATAQRGDPPLIDARAALAHAGVSLESAPVLLADSLKALPNRAADLPGPAAQRSRREGVRRLPRPRPRIRRLQRGILIVLRNRPRNAVAECRSRRGRPRRQRGDRFRLRTPSGVLRCRFVSELSASRWTTVRW